MKAWKRLIGLALTLTLAAGIMPMAIAANAAGLPQNTEAANLAIALGYMDADSSGNFLENQVVTRREFAGYVMRFLSLSDIEMQITKTFLDVTPDMPGYKDVVTAYAMGMYQPIYTDFFSPDSGIKASDAVRAVLVGLGYQPAADVSGGTASAYMNLASRVGLLAGVDTSKELTRNAAAKLFYNGLRVGKMQMSGNGKYETTQETLLESMDIQRGIGRITANEYSSLVSDSNPTAKGKVLIDDAFLVAVGDTNASSLLGYSVIYYYNKRDKSDPYLVMVMPRAETILTVDAKDIVSYEKATGLLTYLENEEVVTETIPPTVDMLYNGRALPGFTEEHMKPELGSITLYASRNGAYDTVFVESYINYVVDYVSTAQMTLYDKYGKTKLELKDKNGYSYTIRTADGAESGIDAIRPGSIVSVQADKELVSSDGRAVDAAAARRYVLVVCDDKEEGSIEEFIDREDEVTVRVNGKELKVARSLQQAINRGHETALKLGTTGTFYLDFKGDIAGYSSELQGAWKYGFLIQGSIGSGLDNTIQLRLLNASGDISIVDVASTYKLDGERYKTHEQAQVNAMQYQLIGYKMNKDGKISEIDTAAVGPNEDAKDSLTVGIELGTYKFNKPCSIFAKDGQTDNFSVDAKATVFSVPTALGPAKEYYGVYKISHFGDYDSYYIQAYNLGDNNATSLIVEYGSEKKPGISYDSSPFMFDHMAYISDEEGNTAYKLYGNSQGREITKVCDASEVSFTGAGIETEPLRRGDIIRTTENNRGKTVTIDRLLSAKAALADEVAYGTVKEEGGDSGYRRQFLTFYGRVYNRDGGLVTLCFEEPAHSPGGTVIKPPLTNINYSKELKVTCYNSEKDWVETVSLGDLESYNVTKDFRTATRVFSYLKYSSGMDLFIIK